MLGSLAIAQHMTACRRRRVAAGVVDPPMGVRLCPGDGQPCHLHAKAGTCGMTGGPTPPAPEPSSPINIDLAHRLWRMLHTATDADDAWVARFTALIPCGDCKTSWLAKLREHPPVFGGGWFEWTWQVHNAVNAELGKPTMTLADATALWLTPTA